MALVVFEKSDLVVEVTSEKIGKELATRYLAKRYQNNRAMNKRTVAKYADDMRSGNWRPCPQGIAFANCASGEVLVDGQHRLQAIIDSNSVIEMLISRGWEAAVSYPSVDAGMAKTLSVRTGTPKFVAQVVTFFSNFISPASSVSIAEHDRILSSFTCDVMRFLEDRASSVKLTSAPIRSAFVAGMMSGVSYEKASYMYRMFHSSEPTGNNSLDRARITLLRYESGGGSQALYIFTLVLASILYPDRKRLTPKILEEVDLKAREIIRKKVFGL